MRVCLVVAERSLCSSTAHVRDLRTRVVCTAIGEEEEGRSMEKNTKYWRRRLAVSAAVFPLALMSAIAAADVISVGFGTAGTYSLVGSCGTNCETVSLTGTSILTGLDSYFGSSGKPAFTFTALLDAAPAVRGIAASGMAPTEGWKLEDSAGDSLFGSLNGFLAFTLGGAAGRVNFDVTDGTGLFDNVSSGSGSAWAGFNQDGWWGDLGDLSLDPGTATSTVPEPGTLLLFAAALAALGCWSASKRHGALAAASL
ncbi:MAG: PEP-CTERM sorting domain-containing protein [Steroidobacteraceae bacterium]